MTYSFGIPNHVIWISHILIGIFITYVAFIGKITRITEFILINIGSLAFFYHAHLMYIGVNIHDHENNIYR